MPAITQPIPNVFRIPIRVTSPLEYLYAHVIVTPHGLIVVDLGVDAEVSRASWAQAEAQLPLAAGSVQAILVSHYHADHVGLAAWASARWQAPVYMLSGEIRTAYRLYQAPKRWFAVWHAWYRRLGVPASTIEPLVATLTEVAREVRLPPKMHPLSKGPWADGAAGFTVLHQRGHTDDHAVLYFPQHRTILCGDQLLARITPNIGYVPWSRPNPLGAYLQALAAIRRLDLSLALPSHQEPVPTVDSRTQAIEAHHQERLATLVHHLAEAGTVFDMVQALFPHSLTPFQLRLALGETLAHLEYARAQNLVTATRHAHTTVYRRLTANGQ